MFNSTGVNAGAANLPNVFRIAPENAVMEIKSRYGKVSRNISVASASFSVSP